MATARMDFRLDEKIKIKAERASALLGMRSTTEYLISLIEENATKVIAEHEKMDDGMCEQLVADIAEKIQNEMEYPGQIKVTVIREYRAIDFAK